MTPKKKSSEGWIVAIIALVIILFLAYNMGIAAVEAKAYDDGQENWNELSALFRIFFERLETNPFKEGLQWNESIRTALLWGFGGWFIACLAIYNSRKNYIHGKEFGTAKWGTVNDIRDLFAENCMKQEIAQAKKVKTPLGRRKAKKKAERFCKDTCEEVRRIRLQDLEQQTQEAKENGTYDKREYKHQKELIDQLYNEDYQEAFREAWKPAKIEYDYQQEQEEIIANAQKGLTITNAKEKEEALRKAKERRDTKLKAFYDGKSRIAGIKKKYSNADALFTRTERISIYNYKLNNNTLIMGGSGSGKTRGFVMPNILQAHSSFVVTDPKGEILEKAGYFLETVKGYKIRVLNLDDKSSSDGYNPFAYIHTDREGYEERVLSLIEAIIVNTDGGEKKGGSDPFWDKAERLFLQAMFFFTCDAFIPEQQNMNTVLQLIGMLQIEEESDNMDSDLDYFARILEQRLNDADKEHHNAGTENIGIQTYKEFRSKASGKTAKSIVISAVARLAPFRTSAVQRIFSYDTMHLDRLGEELTAIFVVVPPTDTTFNFIAGMVFTQMFQELQYCATQVHKHDGQRLPIPVRFILDEFANTCTIPQFTKILAYARSFGIGIVPILQSLEQIKTMYKDEWGVIVDNCNTLLYLGSITHMDTLEYMSKLLGKGTFDKKTTGRTKQYRGGSHSTNYDVVGRELMDTAELRKIPKEDCILVVGGRNPFYSKKYDYPSHPNYKYTSDANRKYSYEYTPPQMPQEVTNPPQISDGVTPTHREEVPHREEIKIPKEQLERECADAVKAIMEKVDKETQFIKMYSDPKQILNEISRAFPHMAVVPDAVLATNDGEAVTPTEDILDSLSFADEDRNLDELMNSLSEEEQEGVKEEIKEIKQSVEADIAENGVKLDDNLVTVAVSVATNAEHLRPVDVSTDDGETEDGFSFDDEEPALLPDADEVGDFGNEIDALLNFASVVNATHD